MVRKFSDATLLIASNNQGKVQELALLLQDKPFTLTSAADYDIEEPEETGRTFIENAILKARYYGKRLNLPALADDSGLAVEALGGAPGIYSARWASPNKDFSIAMDKIHQQLQAESTENFRAHFICALALYWPDGHVESFEGTVEGRLTFPPRGQNGFGYDPIFIPKGYHETFAELDPTIKHAMSHRADAFHQLITACFNE